MKKPECFKSNPNYQDKAENDCRTCKFNNTCFNEWEEEFEDELLDKGNDCYRKYDFTGGYDIHGILNKYIHENRVKVKCKDGMIQIERIK